MRTKTTRAVPAFMPAALAASNVGTWEINVAEGRVVADAITAALFGLDPGAAAHGLSLMCYVRGVHPEDRPVFHDKLEPVRREGGLFVVEYRTRPDPGEVRWVLARGRYERDATGRMQGRGICIDITEGKLDGKAEDRVLFALGPTHTPLEQAADAAIAAREAIDRLQEPGRRTLRQRVDALLWDVGRAIARESD
jgi:hypothetical protein